MTVYLVVGAGGRPKTAGIRVAKLDGSSLNFAIISQLSASGDSASHHLLCNSLVVSELEGSKVMRRRTGKMWKKRSKEKEGRRKL